MTRFVLTIMLCVIATIANAQQPVRTALKRVQTGVERVCFGDHCEMLPTYAWVIDDAQFSTPPIPIPDPVPNMASDCPCGSACACEANCTCRSTSMSYSVVSDGTGYRTPVRNVISGAIVGASAGIQAKANAQANRRRMFHTGSIIGGNFEGVGSGSTPQQALDNCCRPRAGVVAQEAVAQGANGRWYAVRVYNSPSVGRWFRR